MSETIRVQGRECVFSQSSSLERQGAPWLITPRGKDLMHLAASGKWSHKMTRPEDWHPTEAAAREFARKHADQPAGGEASGCELPTGYPSPGVLKIYKQAAHEQGELFCWCVQNLEKFPPIEGDWLEEVKRRLRHPAPASELAELRAEVERLTKERDAVG